MNAGREHRECEVWMETEVSRDLSRKDELNVLLTSLYRCRRRERLTEDNGKKHEWDD